MVGDSTALSIVMADAGSIRDLQEQCAFNGAWGGSVKPTAFYVSSYFWDRATDAGIIGEKAAITWTLKPTDFSAAAAKACSSNVAGLSSSFPDVSL